MEITSTRLSNAKVKFSDTMHANVDLASNKSNMDKSKVIRSAMLLGLEELYRISDEKGNSELTAVIAKLDKLARG